MKHMRYGRSMGWAARSVVIAGLLAMSYLLYPQAASAASISFNSQAAETQVGDWVVGEPVENLSMDIDGDHHQDLVRVFRSPAGKAMADILFSNNGSGFYRPGPANPIDVGGWQESGERVQELTADVNADGKDDLLRVWRTGDGKAMSDTLFSNGTSLYRPDNPIRQELGDWSSGGELVKRYAMYVNGDKKRDLVSIFKNAAGKAMVDVLFSDGNGGFYRPGAAAPLDIGDWATYGEPVQSVVTDLNGDQKEDLLRLWKTADGQAGTDILYSDGNGFYRPSSPIVQQIGDWSAAGEVVYTLPMDIDKDGKQDIVRIFKTAAGRRSVDVMYSSGNAFYRPGPAAPVDFGPGDDMLLINASKPFFGKACLFQLRKSGGQTYAQQRCAYKNYTHDGDHLSTNQYLHQDHYLASPNGYYKLLMQDDGNLVLYDAGWRPLWASNTMGAGGTFVALQGDGNVVMYRPNGTAVWATNTVQAGGVSFDVQNDGNVVLYNQGGTALWATHTATGSPNPKVMAYNIAENSSPETVEAFARTIEDKSPDIVLINDIKFRNSDEYPHPVRDPISYLAGRLGYAHWHYQPTANTGLTGSKGIGILSRYPILDKQYYAAMALECLPFAPYLPPIRCPESGILKASMDIRGIRHEVFSLRLAPLHPTDHPAYHWGLEPTNKAGHNLARQLVQAVPANHAVIMGGDFNASWNEHPWHADFRNTNGMRDPVTEFWQRPYRLDDWGGHIIDYIYFRGPYTVRDAKLTDGYPGASDHIYVYTELTYDPAGAEALATGGGSSMNY